MDESAATAPGKRVLIVAIFIDAWLLFFGRALSRVGYDVTLVTYRSAITENHDHDDIMKYFMANPFARFVDFRDLPAQPETPYDFAIVGTFGSNTLEQKRQVLDVVGKTPIHAVVLRHFNNRFKPMTRLIVKEILHPFLRRSPRILIEEFKNSASMLNLLSPAARLGVVPHQRVICDGLPENVLNEGERPYLFNFLGSYSGPRVPVIDRLESLLGISTGGDQKVSLGDKTFRIMWHADRPDSTRERPLNEYLDTLRGSVFTLCLPGHAIITHRALETAQCGGIPVMPDDSVPEYLLPFEHGRNCWLVKNNDWESAMTEVMALDPAKIAAMQEGVRQLARGDASIPALEAKSLRQLDLKPI